MVYIYVLKLRNNKYYVGKTNNPQFLLESHFNLNGSEWTKIYKPVKDGCVFAPVIYDPLTISNGPKK